MDRTRDMKTPTATMASRWACRALKNRENESLAPPQDVAQAIHLAGQAPNSFMLERRRQSLDTLLHRLDRCAQGCCQELAADDLAAAPQEHTQELSIACA